MNFFENLELILRSSTKEQKIDRFKVFYRDFLENRFDFESKSEPKVFDKPSYGEFLNSVKPRDVPRRKNIATKEGKAILAHAIAHIEYSAIDLALDASYRFRDMPREFYSDWLEVADDEIRHFLMLEDILTTLDCKYGDFDVHDGLFEASCKSLTLLERMALIPRYMEANGLDSNPVLIKKLSSNGGDKNQDLIEALKVILDEEIEHVRKGDRWFKYACLQEKIEPSEYFNIVESIYPNSFKNQGKKPLNIEARIKSGFDERELSILKGE